MSARLESHMRKEFADEEGTGEKEKTRDEIKAEKAKEKARVRKIKESKLRRMRKEREEKRIPEPSRDELKLAAELEKPDEDSDEEKDGGAHKKETTPAFGPTKIATDKDKLKRKDQSKLRTPFDVKVDLEWRNYCTYPPLVVLGALVLAKITTTNYFEIYQPTNPYGLYESSIVLTSFFVNLLAIICDGKEVYSCLKYVFAVRDEWVPMITVGCSLSLTPLSLFLLLLHRLPSHIHHICLF